MRDLATLTADSALPLPCGQYGEEVRWSMAHSVQNEENVELMNWRPLSVKRTSGRPWRANWALLHFTTVVASVSGKASTSKKSEKWSTVIKKWRESS